MFESRFSILLEFVEYLCTAIMILLDEPSCCFVFILKADTDLLGNVSVRKIEWYSSTYLCHRQDRLL